MALDDIIEAIRLETEAEIAAIEEEAAARAEAIAAEGRRKAAAVETELAATRDDEAGPARLSRLTRQKPSRPQSRGPADRAFRDMGLIPSRR